MNLKELELADISLVELRDDGKIGRSTPHCKVHGVLLRPSDLEGSKTSVAWRDS